MSQSQPINIAVIDFGTLKSKFEIRKMKSLNDYDVLLRKKGLTYLGEDIKKNNNRISEDGLNKLIEVLTQYKADMDKHEVTKYSAVATEAFRIAENSGEILEEIEKETGIRIMVLSQSDEAELYFQSITYDFPEEKIAVCDIGGGSVQLVIGKGDDVEKTFLFKTGTYFLMEDFPLGDEDLQDNLGKRKERVEKELTPLKDLNQQINTLVYGSTNIIDFFKAIGIKGEPIKDTVFHESKAKVSDISARLQEISEMPEKERIELFPDEPHFMITADNAILSVLQIVENLGIEWIVPTNNNLSSGLFLQLFQQAKKNMQ